MPNINSFISALGSMGSLLTGNRYKVTMEKLQGENFVYLCNKVDLPSIDYTQVDLDVGGKVVHVPSKFSLGDLQMTFYNTGAELKKFHEFCDSKMFAYTSSPATHAVGYYDEVCMNIQVAEYDIKNTQVVTHIFGKCILKSISQLSLSYAPVSDFQQFTISFSCSSYVMI